MSYTNYTHHVLDLSDHRVVYHGSDYDSDARDHNFHFGKTLDPHHAAHSALCFPYLNFHDSYVARWAFYLSSLTPFGVPNWILNHP